MPSINDLPLLVWTVDEGLTVRFCGGRLKDLLEADPCERLDEMLNRLLGESSGGDHALRDAHKRALAGERGSCRINLYGRQLLAVIEPISSGDFDGGCIGVAVDGEEPLHREAELRRHIAELDEIILRQEEEIAASQEQLLVSEHLAATGMLASGLGHDIGNTLLPLRLRVDALERLNLGERAERDLDAIRQSMEYLRRLSNSLRQLVRDSDDVDSAGHSLNIAQWWENVGPLLTKAIPKGVHVEQSIAPDLPRVAIAEHQLTQAMLSVITNAGEAVAAGGNIRISSNRAADDESAILIQVADDGPGMAPEVASRLMQPFYTSKTRRFTTGLGLFVVRGILRRAGGSIGIESAPGRGTIVTLRVPIAARDVGSQAGAPHQPIALIDIHDPRLAAYASTLLSTSGYRVRRGLQELPAEKALFVVDARDESLDLARARRNAHAQETEIIAVGADPDREWAGLGAIVVDPSEGAVALRSALRRALEKFYGHRSFTKDHQSAGR